MAVNKKLAAKGGAVGAVVAAILSSVFMLEGGYVNDPKDPGGETNHGVTKKVAQSHKDVLAKEYGWNGTMKGLTKDMAAEVYVDDYIIKPNFIEFASISPAVTHKLVDAGVNAGTSRPARWLQESLNDISRNGKDYPKVQVDGKVGAATINSYKALQKKRGKVEACRAIIKLLDGKQLNHYTSLNMPDYTYGWITNRIGNVPLEACNDDANL